MVKVPVKPPEHIAAGQRLGEAADRVMVRAATGVAAKAVDDVPTVNWGQQSKHFARHPNDLVAALALLSQAVNTADTASAMGIARLSCTYDATCHDGATNYTAAERGPQIATYDIAPFSNRTAHPTGRYPTTPASR